MLGRMFGSLALLVGVLFSSTDLLAAVPGPIQVSRDGRHFVDHTGKPFFWLGDTAWPLLVEYPRATAEAYLKNRGAKGFSVVQTVVAWTHGGTGSEKARLPMPNVAGQKLWLNDNPATPNDAYFKDVDHLVEVANQNGIVLAVLPTWGYYVNESKTITTANARAYGRWLGTRYKNASNIVWVLGGDRLATGFEPVWREMAAGLAEGDGGTHLVTYHPCGWRSSGQYFHDEPWLDFNMIETWTEWSKVYPAVVADSLLTPRKPVVLAEGAYENGPEYPQGPITPLLVRRQAWWTVTAGGFHTYGQDQMWRMQSGWEKTFDTPGANQMGTLKEIMSALPWWDLVPDQSLFATGISSERTLNTAMRSKSSNLALVYLSSQTTVFIHMDKIMNRSVRASWINPLTGARKAIAEYRTGNLNDTAFTGELSVPFTTPGHWEDAILLLEGL
jgi:hypothetical protein